MRKLRPFLRDGRIIQWPARESRRRLVLAEVVRAFQPGKRLAEADVDAILREFWPDHCQLRRAPIPRPLLNPENGAYLRGGLARPPAPPPTGPPAPPPSGPSTVRFPPLPAHQRPGVNSRPPPSQ